MKTLIIIDVQNDFMPGGALAVPKGDEIVGRINKVQPLFDLCICTQDWHPQNHKSFASNHDGKKVFEKIKLKGIDQILWPDHCVQGSSGAAFHAALNTRPVEAIFRKGMNTDMDSYSGFYDNGHQKSTGLAGYLREKRVSELYFCGLAADICVYYTVLDALKENFKVNLLLDATKPLDSEEFSTQLKELKSKGVNLIKTEDLLR